MSNKKGSTSSANLMKSMLKGGVEFREGAWQFDAVSRRIEWLIANHLILIAQDASGWYQLYQDPADHSYWELSYPQSERHGGGPPSLTQVAWLAIKDKYPL